MNRHAVAEKNVSYITVPIVFFFYSYYLRWFWYHLSICQFGFSRGTHAYCEAKVCNTGRRTVWMFIEVKIDRVKVPLKRNFHMWDFYLIIKFELYFEILPTFLRIRQAKTAFSAVRSWPVEPKIGCITLMRRWKFRVIMGEETNVQSARKTSFQLRCDPGWFGCSIAFFMQWACLSTHRKNNFNPNVPHKVWVIRIVYSVPIYCWNIIAKPLGQLRAVKQLITGALDLKRRRVDHEAFQSIQLDISRIFYVSKQTSASCLKIAKRSGHLVKWRALI